MEAADVLDEAAVERALGDRPKRFYPALISTESDAIAWAASGGPEGAVVVAGHAITPRGHGERPWVLKPEKSVLFTFIVRPNLPPLKAGLLYMVGVSGIADVLGEGTTIEWPADVYRGDVLAGAVGVRTSSDPGRIQWATISCVVFDADGPRAQLLQEVVEAVEHRYQSPPAQVLADYTPRCTTLGRRVCARLVPVGPAGRRIAGRAALARDDGSLMIEVEQGRMVPVRPQSVGLLEDAEEA